MSTQKVLIQGMLQPRFWLLSCFIKKAIHNPEELDGTIFSAASC
jgi:hypothetical protein